MLETILVFLSFYSMTFILGQSAILDSPRVWLMGKHELFIKLFNCNFCLGWWAGIIIYFLYILGHGFLFNPFIMIIWALGSSSTVAIMDVIIQKLSWEKE